MSNEFVAGIDIGTTSVKLAIIDSSTEEFFGVWSLDTDASVPGCTAVYSASEQDPGRIVSSLQRCLLQVPEKLRIGITRIGVSGQMHGVVLWKSWKTTGNESGKFHTADRISPLYTWQDGRCSPDFLASLPKPESHLRLASGFGCATLFWLQRHLPESLEWYDCAGTIQDYVVAVLCGLDRPVMSTQNAASWGYFNLQTNAWNKQTLSQTDFPVHLLPEVKRPGAIAGHTSTTWCSIPGGASVLVAMGDLQCSILSRLRSRTKSAVVNISTSAQVCFAMPDDFLPPVATGKGDGPVESVEYFPYFENRYLAVAASLNGGNVLALFVEMLQQWTAALGIIISSEHIWNCLHVSSEGASSSSASLPIIVPTVFGERHQPEVRGSVTNITPFNTSLASVYRGLCQGVACNLFTMMPPQMLKAAGIVDILGSGSALVRNKCLHEELQALYKLPIEISGDEVCDSAAGAALAAAAKS